MYSDKTGSAIFSRSASVIVDNCLRSPDVDGVCSIKGALYAPISRPISRQATTSSIAVWEAWTASNIPAMTSSRVSPSIAWNFFTAFCTSGMASYLEIIASPLARSFTVLIFGNIAQAAVSGGYPRPRSCV